VISPLFDGIGLLYDLQIFFAMYESLKVCVMGSIEVLLNSNHNCMK